MRVFHEIRKRFWQIGLQVLFALVFGYFAYHLMYGDRGLLAWLRLNREFTEAQATRAQLAEQEQELAHRVGLLRAGNLDPDLLDERARILLNYGREDDLVILLPPDQQRQQSDN